MQCYIVQLKYKLFKEFKTDRLLFINLLETTHSFKNINFLESFSIVSPLFLVVSNFIYEVGMSSVDLRTMGRATPHKSNIG